MPVPVQIFLVVFTLFVVALPVAALRAHRGGALSDAMLSLSWAPLMTWLVTPLMVRLGGQTPPVRGVSALIAVVLLCGMAAAVAVALAKGAPRAVRILAWVCALGLLLRAVFAAVAALVLLPY